MAWNIPCCWTISERISRKITVMLCGSALACSLWAVCYFVDIVGNYVDPTLIVNPSCSWWFDRPFKIKLELGLDWNYPHWVSGLNSESGRRFCQTAYKGMSISPLAFSLVFSFSHFFFRQIFKMSITVCGGRAQLGYVYSGQIQSTSVTHASTTFGCNW